MDTLTPQHQAREELNVIGLLAQCMQIPNATPAELLQWKSDLAVAGGRLQCLYGQGLNRRDLLAQIRAEADGAAP